MCVCVCVCVYVYVCICTYIHVYMQLPASVELAPIDHYRRAALVTLQKTRVSMGKA